MMTLEDLLSYMNRGHDSDNKEPTFISIFHTPGKGSNPTKALVTTKKVPVTTIKPLRDTELTQLTTTDDSWSIRENNSANKSRTSKSNTEKTTTPATPKQEHPDYSKELEDVSAEYDAIEGKKYRKHKRVGRVLDVPNVPLGAIKRHIHSHVFARSPTETPLSEDITDLELTQSGLKGNSSSSLSLFSTDRSRAKDFRKRRRFQNRRRKVLTTASSNSTDSPVLSDGTTTVSTDTARHDLDNRKITYRRRKTNRTRINHYKDEDFNGWYGVNKPEKVEPYTLPPLPFPEDEHMDITTETMQKKEKLSQGSKKKAEDIWHKTTYAPVDDNLKFGDKLAELHQHHHYQPNGNTQTSPAGPVDFYGEKGAPDASEELLTEEYHEKISVQPPLQHEKFSQTTRKSKFRNSKKFKGESDLHILNSSESEKQSTIKPQHLFPPPRAEPREQQSIHHHQMLNSHEDDKETTVLEEIKTTTENPFRVSRPYLGKYQTDVRELAEIEEQRWKAESTSNGKIAVGSTFSSQTTPETTLKPRLQVPLTTESPVTNSIYREKETPKHTLAHQHLSKLMNDFFAMSAPHSPSMMQMTSKKNKDELFIPDYRIPEEDIYEGSESVAEEVEELPSELLEVVDFITRQDEDEKKDLKGHTSHEIIKINGPITDEHLEKIFSDDKSTETERRKIKSRKNSIPKIVVVPPEDKDDMKDITEVAQFTSLRLEPLLKQMMAEDKSVSAMPLKHDSIRNRQPAVLTAKKIPVRVIYRDQLSESRPQATLTRKPNVKLVRSRLPTPNYQIIHNGRISHQQQIYPPNSKPQSPIVLHPPSMHPPHPPPIPRKHFPFRIGFPFTTGIRPFLHNTRNIPRRKKRSITSRLRRQIRQNQNFLPFSSPVFPTFNPKFAPTFSPFRNIFNQNPIHSSGSNLSPFTFPGFAPRRPSIARPQIFKQSHTRPPPVRHVTQAGQQTVIVEEVPVPVHVEMPAPNTFRPAHSGSHQSNLIQRLPNQFRVPTPPAVQTPPLLQGPQSRYPIRNNYRPFGMPSNIGPPAINFRPSLPFSAQLPPTITSQGQVYALGVTTKPFMPAKPPPVRPLAPGKIPPGPFQPFDVHANAYPNFPYFQGAFTTPISHEPVVGRLMYSGYKPPKSTVATKPPKSNSRPDKEQKEASSNSGRSNRSRAKHVQSHFSSQSRPAIEEHSNYKAMTDIQGRSKQKPNIEDSFRDQSFKPPRQNLANMSSTSSEDIIPRKRRPGRRRRPRPYSTSTSPTAHIRNNISPTPPPPEQIPPPPADYTSAPYRHEISNALPAIKENPTVPETSSLYPPAGYYGKDQLGQFFDSSSKSHKKESNQKPHQQREFGESTSSAESEESVLSFSSEDGEPAFGTRLRSKSRSNQPTRKKLRQPEQSSSQNTEVRTRPLNKPDEKRDTNKAPSYSKASETGRFQSPNLNRNEGTLPRRRRPPPPRPRNRPPTISSSKPEMHHFNDNGGFYSVPRGLQNFVPPSERPPPTFRGSTDMFGIPHPPIDQSIYSLRPQGAPVDFNPNFFSVPPHVEQQQKSPLHNMNIKSMPKSAREFFTAAQEESSKARDANSSEKNESEERSVSKETSGENSQQRESPPRKLRKPKRKNRYNPRNNAPKEHRDVTTGKPQTEHGKARENNAIRYKEKVTTAPSTTYEPHVPTSPNSQNDIKDPSVVFKQRPPLLPKTLPEISKSLLNGKLDIQKLNATISTSVSVSGGFPRSNNASSEDNSKRVFSSQNGGLAVVRKGPKRKRVRPRTTTISPFANDDESSTNAKYEIAASVLDIIKATTETERQASGFYSNSYQTGENPSPSRVYKSWSEKPSANEQEKSNKGSR
ncbi:hypothetical protein X975_19821, partial [Stegodyphus mimosarum]